LRWLHTSPITGLVIEQHHAFFRHVAKRMARSLAADAGVLHPAKGELIVRQVELPLMSSAGPLQPPCRDRDRGPGGFGGSPPFTTDQHRYVDVAMETELISVVLPAFAVVMIVFARIALGRGGVVGHDQVYHNSN